MRSGLRGKPTTGFEALANSPGISSPRATFKLPTHRHCTRSWREALAVSSRGSPGLCFSVHLPEEPLPHDRVPATDATGRGHAWPRFDKTSFLKDSDSPRHWSL